MKLIYSITLIILGIFLVLGGAFGLIDNFRGVVITLGFFLILMGLSIEDKGKSLLFEFPFEFALL